MGRYKPGWDEEKKVYILDEWCNSMGTTSCLSCKHLIGPYKCKAFDEIPIEIWSGLNPHTEPYPGDKGIRYEKLESAEQDS